MRGEQILRVPFEDGPQATRGRISTRTADLPSCRLVQVTFAPGARWSVDAAPFAGTQRCQRPHDAVVVSGALMVQLGCQPPQLLAPGEALHLPADHDAWNEGDEPCVFLEIEVLHQSSPQVPFCSR